MSPPPPFKHQTEALERSGRSAYFAYLMEMGTGKTRVLIDDACRAYRLGAIDRVVIFANKGSYANWETELTKHMPDDVDWDIHVWRGMHSQAEKGKYRRFSSPVPGFLRFFVLNIESLSANDRSLDLCEAFIRGGSAMLVIDESTKVKNEKASRTKGALYLARIARMRRILTGLIAPRSPMDIWSQFEVLSPGLLAKSWWGFRGRYAQLETQFYQRRKPDGSTKTEPVDVIVGFKNLEELSDKIGQYSYRVMKKDCLDIPEKIFMRREVDFTDAQTKAYIEMKKLATTQLANGQWATATNALSMQMRLQQIVCGHLRTEDGLLTQIPHNRIKELLEILEETEESTVIWCAFQEDIRQIKEAIVGEYGPHMTVEYHGGVKQLDRERGIREFQAGQARFFLGTPATGAHGITLTTGTMVIYYSNSNNLELRLQSEDRTHRAGQRNVVTYIDLVSPDTVDEKILYALRNKLDMASLIQKDGWQKWAV